MSLNKKKTPLLDLKKTWVCAWTGRRKKRSVLAVSILVAFAVAAVLAFIFLPSNGNIQVTGDFSASDIAAMKRVVRRQRWRESWNQVLRDGIGAIPSAARHLTNQITDISEPRGFVIPTDATSNRYILAEANVRVAIQFGPNSGHDIYILKKDADGWSWIPHFVSHPPLYVPEDPAEAIPVLIKYFHDPVSWFRLMALDRLRGFRYFPESKSAVPALIMLLKDPDERVRKQAAITLKQIDSLAAAKAGVK